LLDEYIEGGLSSKRTRLTSGGRSRCLPRDGSAARVDSEVAVLVIAGVFALDERDSADIVGRCELDGVGVLAPPGVELVFSLIGGDECCVVFEELPANNPTRLPADLNTDLGGVVSTSVSSSCE
jgi:hypothetical protein